MDNRFDKNAASWDAKEYRLKLAENISKSVRTAVKLDPAMDLMDFGCGTGLVSLPLASEVASLTGVDTSTGMLEVFMEKAMTMELHNVKCLNLNLGNGEVLPGAYDLILSSMTFHHVKNVLVVIRSMYGALRPGGYLCIADLDLDSGLFHADNTDVHHFGFDREVMKEYFREAGFVDVSATTATAMPRVGEDGVERVFPVFLVTGIKK